MPNTNTPSAHGPRLYSYSLRVDDGAAPNPFGGVCTLAICKPAIRRTAQLGDWIVGLGSKNAPDGRDLSLHVVYAMRVGKRMSFQEYDQHCQANLPIKIPVWSVDSPFEALVGDCLYAYDTATGLFAQRRGVHVSGEDQKRDLGGKQVLLSDKFFYFGNQAAPLQKEWEQIAHPYQGHKVHANIRVKDAVIAWLESGLGGQYEPNCVIGTPLHRDIVLELPTRSTWESSCRQREADDVKEELHIC